MKAIKFVLTISAAVALFNVGAQEVRITEARMVTNEFSLKFSGSAAFNTRLESSVDLVNWTALYTFPKTNGAIAHTDTAARYQTTRFYRVAQLTTTNAIAGDHLATSDGDVVIRPVTHASFVMGWKDKTIYVDPDGATSLYAGLPRPTLVFITDIHGDHLDSATLSGLEARNADIVAPPQVFQMLASDLRAKTRVMTNGATTEVQGIQVLAIPMYNTTAGRTGHTKGRGNGYVLTIGGKRIYISGDTEDIPEMRALREIDMAFVCMNLPFTMDINQAASAVREFKPKVVFPYHYSSSDVVRFKQLVGVDVGVEVRLRKWY